MSSFRAQRLARDLLFLRANPIEGVALAPIERDDMSVWHGNVSLSDDGTEVYHFVVAFPDDYPLSAPVVRFQTAVPHVNILTDGAVCCEQLGNSKALVDGSLGWTSAYGPYTVALMVLAMAGNLSPLHNGVSRQEAGRRASVYKCGCGHAPGKTWPSLDHATSRVAVFTPPKVTLMFPRERTVVARPSAPTVSAVAVARTIVAPAVPPKKAVVEPLPVKQQQETSVVKATKGWVVVGKPKKEPVAKAKKTTTTKKKVDPTLPVEQDVVPVGWDPVDEAEERLKAKRAREKSRRAVKRAKEAVAAAQAKAELVLAKQSSKKAGKTGMAIARVDAATAMGAFRGFPVDVMCFILRHLDTRDVLMCAQLCRGFDRVAKNTFLWKDLYAREFPNSSPAQMGDFRHAYTLRLQGVVSELRCFHTKLSLSDSDDVVLGFGLVFTRNPRTAELDYVDAAPELLSQEAFYQHRVRVGARGEEIKAFLPLFLTMEHFRRSKFYDALRKVVTQLCPNDGLELGAVRLLTCALNTRSVLLADKGVSTADSSLTIFSQLQRLFMALYESLPGVAHEVERRLASFISSDRNREKKACPSLGELIPLLLVSKRHTWAQVRGPIVREVLARNVLWAGRHNAALARNDSALTAEERCAQFWEGTIVSNRLLMLSAMFVSVTRREGLAEAARVLDRLYGKPTSKTLSTMKRATAAILDAKASWPMYCKVLLGAPVGLTQMEGLLKEAVKASRAKGYHSATTNFAAVHSSGTSKILKKGESYTTGKDVNDVTLTLGWNWEDANMVYRLDACCLFYSRGKKVGHVDWDQRMSSVTGRSVEHSGDVMDIARQAGEHAIHISLRILPKEIDTLYLLLCSVCYCGARGCTVSLELNNVTHPFVSLSEAKSKTELCSFSIEKAGRSQAVIMAKLVRSLTGWKVVPMGVTSSGNSVKYDPIEATIANLDKREQ